MSGLLRRIKRARDAGGDPSAEGAPTAPDGAPVTSDPAAASAGPAAPTPMPAAPEVAPAVPAGVDPAAGPPPPKGSRSRLRKRLRYLRRARELMLRDLGGLLYEIHRTGGGRIDAHAGVVGPKVARLAALDNEAHGIEAALGATHPETVVFEPGVGGACTVCGELYPSGARFCANCGTTTTTTPPAPAAEPPTSELAERSSPSLGLAPAPPEQPPPANEGATAPDTADPGAMNGHAPTERGSTDPLPAREARP